MEVVKTTVTKTTISPVFVNIISDFCKNMEIINTSNFRITQNVKVYSIPAQIVPYYKFSKYYVEYLVYYNKETTKEELQKEVTAAIELTEGKYSINNKTNYYFVPVRNREFSAVIVRFGGVS